MATAIKQRVTAHDATTLGASYDWGSTVEINSPYSRSGGNSLALYISYTEGTEATGLKVKVRVSDDGSTWYERPLEYAIAKGGSGRYMLTLPYFHGFDNYIQVGVVADGAVGATPGSVSVLAQSVGIHALDYTT